MATTKYLSLAGLTTLVNKIKSYVQSQAYTLPAATSTILGGVKVGKGLTMTDEALGISSDLDSSTIAGKLNSTPRYSIAMFWGFGEFATVSAVRDDTQNYIYFDTASNKFVISVHQEAVAGGGLVGAGIWEAENNSYSKQSMAAYGSESSTGVEPNEYFLYYCITEHKFYQWNGSAMTEI